MIRLRIPATSANIGPGFDSIGLAVGLYNEVTMEEWDGVQIESPVSYTHLDVYKRQAMLFHRFCILARL